jgi:hypothetical protein
MDAVSFIYPAYSSNASRLAAIPTWLVQLCHTRVSGSAYDADIPGTLRG